MKVLRKGNNRSRLSGGGFTLLEVMVAMAILVACLVPLLSAIIGGLRSTANARDIIVATQLARNKMTQMELETFPEFEGKDSGDFGKEFPNYTWRTEIYKRPELELLEDQIPGLNTMEVHLYINWHAGITEKEIEVFSLLAD